jgi:hypothetical protein
MPDWIADKKQRAERIRQAKAELEAEAKAGAEAKAQQQPEAEGRKKSGRPAAPPSTTPKAKAQRTSPIRRAGS